MCLKFSYDIQSTEHGWFLMALHVLRLTKEIFCWLFYQNRTHLSLLFHEVCQEFSQFCGSNVSIVVLQKRENCQCLVVLLRFAKKSPTSSLEVYIDVGRPNIDVLNNLELQNHNSGTIQRTEMADHLLESFGHKKERLAA